MPNTPANPDMPQPPSAPDWYKSVKGTDPFSTSANALIPYLSPSDQQSVATMLGNNYASAFGSYINAKNTANTSGVGVAPYYLNSTRASQALQALNNMSKAGGFSAAQMGPGYQYLQTVLNTISNLSGGADTTTSRADYQKLQNTLSSLPAQTSDKLKAQYAGVKKGAATVRSFNLPAWESLANMFANPSFTTGSIAPTFTVKGRTQYGSPNTRLFE